MAITYPRDLLTGFPGSSVRFDLAYVQEVSPTRGGVQHSADLGPALWEAEYQSRILKPSVLREWKAYLASLENGAKTFNGYDLTACFPLAYPSGSWPTGLSFSGIATLNEVNTANYREVRIGGLPDGYRISVGDYFSYAYGSYRALHQAMEAVIAGASGITALFEVRPAIRPHADLDASPQPSVSLIKPHAVMTLIPGSVSAPSDLSAHGSISFAARQTISAS